MASAAEFNRVAKLDHPDLVAVFLAEQRHSAAVAGLVYADVAELLQRGVGTDKGVYHTLHFVQCLFGYLLVVGEVESERRRADVRTFLLHVGAQYLAQHIVQQVGCSVVVLDVDAALHIHGSVELCGGVAGQMVHQMYGKAVLLDGVEHLETFAVGRADLAGVANLAAHLSVEGGDIQYNLYLLLVLCGNGAVLDNPGIGLGGVIAHKLAL